MKALKALVVVMGILIVAGVGLVIYGVITQFGPGADDDAPMVAEPVPAPAVAPPLEASGQTQGAGNLVSAEPVKAFGDIVLDEPATTTITGATTGDGRILLRLSGGGRPDRVVVLSAMNGARLGSVTLGGTGDDAPSEQDDAASSGQ